MLIIGPFFTGHLRPDDSMRGRASMLSNMRYHTSVIIALFSALGSLASSSRKLMKLGAYADRIVSLHEVARHVSDGAQPPACSRLPTRGGQQSVLRAWLQSLRGLWRRQGCAAPHPHAWLVQLRVAQSCMFACW